MRNLGWISLACMLSLAGCGGSSSSSTEGSSSTTSGSESGAATIVATAQGAGSFNTLVAAVQAAGLVDTLSGPGPFTVFAPTDAAFAALPAGTLDNLLLPENREQLQAILTYHVVAGDVRAAQVTTMSSATTVNGAPIAIAVEGGSVRLNGSATVTQADIACSNGVIHVIDQVILPPAQ
jgi:uncharacterized surface protein with fasciclin (FAS1) repeats